MDGRRGGRRGTTLLPLRSRTRHHPNSISCSYCDVKFVSLNEPLYRFGRKYSRYFRVWFLIGIGFSLAALVAVTLLVLCELFGALLVYTGNGSPGYSLSWLSSLLTGVDFSLLSIGYLCVSTVICVLVHEFGHALAAASEGIQMEYLAIFLAVLFPGALVAFDNALLQALSRVASLRIYCAGVWHNAAFCAVCIFSLFLLPVILSPFYIYGESPMVLDVSSSSPLSGYLLPRDVIISLGDIPIRSTEDWKMAIALLTQHTHTLSPHQADGMLNANKGYCVPHPLIERSIVVDFMGNQTSCPNDFFAFASVSCGDSSNYDGGVHGDGSQKQHIHCMDAKDIVKLKRCVNNSLQLPTNGSVCLCSEVESCLVPLQLPGQGWAEIKYSTPHCRSSLSNKVSSNIERNCFQTFVFVGDLISMGNSIRMTSYQPRWSSNFASYLPSQLESFLTCLFHVSMVLALLNSLPVFCLDGESILEATIDSFGFLSPRKKALVLRTCLLGGTLISVCFILLTLFLSRRPMEALVCRELGDPNTALTLSRDHPIPQLRSPTDVRIRVKANSLNFLSYLQVQGKYQEKPPLPFIPGSDYSGIVDAVGSQVTNFRIGDPVIADADVGSFAQFIVTEESNLFMVPEGCDLVAASALPIAYRTSHLALIHRAQLRLGQVLLVLGAAGGVGVSAVQIGKLHGAIVIAVARGDEKVQFLKSLNVDHVVDMAKENVNESVKAFLKARDLKGVDVLYDPVGGKLTKESLKLLNWGAQILVIGFASGEVPVIPVNIALVKNWTVHGLYLGGYKTVDPRALEDSLKQLLSWLARGLITVNISHTFSFSEVHLAFAALKDRKAIGKVVIVSDNERFARPML